MASTVSRLVELLVPVVGAVAARSTAGTRSNAIPILNARVPRVRSGPWPLPLTDVPSACPLRRWPWLTPVP